MEGKMRTEKVKVKKKGRREKKRIYELEKDGTTGKER